MHRAWNYFVAQIGLAMETYFREFFDPCLREPFDPAGPFCECSPQVTRKHGRATGREQHVDDVLLLAMTEPAGL